jgi:hypothetical protein
MADETRTCPRCGSTRAEQGPAGCLAEKSCRARRCAARIEAERVRRRQKHVGQCGGTTGTTSIRFCQLGEGHTGPHVSNTTEWEGNEQHPIARKLLGPARVARAAAAAPIADVVSQTITPGPGKAEP